MDKDERFEFRLKKEDRQRLEELAQNREESMAVVLRELIRRAHFKMNYDRSRVGGGA